MSSFAFLAAFALSRAAYARPGGTGVERAASTALDFLSGTLGPLVLGLGIVIAAYGLVFGNRDGIQKAVWVMVGGVILFSVDSIVAFISSAAR
jgi:type IV secretory pathway VirB2 component (pilin)